MPVIFKAINYKRQAMYAHHFQILQGKLSRKPAYHIRYNFTR